jgi:hypothetical protein
MRAVQRCLGLAGAAIGISLALALGVGAASQSEIFLLVLDQQGVPVLDLKPSDVEIQEDAGSGTIVSIRRYGWPLKLTVLVDNGPGTADSLVHLRNGLNRLLDGIPRDISVSLIATAPNPRWLIRESKDLVQIRNAIGRLTPDDHLARFSDALGEYAGRLDGEFRKVEEGLPPYLPVLVSIATTHADGSEVVRERNEQMLLSLRKHQVWTNMIMVTPARGINTPGRISNLEVDEGQNSDIAHLVREVTRGDYVPVSSGATSGLSSTILPTLARAIALRYLRQMTQHHVVFGRAPGAAGPMKNFRLTIANHPGARIIVSADGSMP